MTRAGVLALLLSPALAFADAGGESDAWASLDAASVSPVEKVVTMLEDLQTQVIMEGKMEAKTYDKFACFCKDLSEQKSADITDGQDSADAMTGRINALSADRADITASIAELTSRISTLTNDMASATAARKKGHIEFLKLEAELDIGVKELDGAANAIKSGTGGAASLVQNTLQDAISVQTANLIERSQKGHPLLAALLDDGDKLAASSDIVETIEEIGTDFEK